MNKKLTMGIIKEDNKRYKEYLTIDVDVNGENHEVKIYPYFAPEKVAKLRDDFIEFIRNTKKEKVEVDDNEWSDIIGYFIIKHFTDIAMTTSKKAKTIYAEYKQVINSTVTEFILKQFPVESILYVHDKINEISEMEEKLIGRIKNVQKEIKDLDLENKDILLGKKKQIPEV
ncbi:hypothetical protein [Metabacillus sp. Hm71]|uniref:hypothetical protein n=1 Tax=Metabacillus sp. Hm71 TaxID=3450743 RepID=UPI003F4214C3